MSTPRRHRQVCWRYPHRVRQVRRQDFLSAAGLYSLDEVCAIISKEIGKTVMYKQISLKELRQSLPLLSVLVGIFAEGMSSQEFRYFGLGFEKLVA